jgi:hypothetical protein
LAVAVVVAVAVAVAVVFAVAFASVRVCAMSKKITPKVAHNPYPPRQAQV